MWPLVSGLCFRQGTLVQATAAPVGLAALVPEHDDDLGAWWLRQRRRPHREARPPFDSLTLLVAWSLWKERNARTFRQTMTSVHDVFRVVVAEADDCIQAGFKTLLPFSAVWPQNTVPL